MPFHRKGNFNRYSHPLLRLPFHLPYLLPLPLHIMKCLETAMLEDGAVLGIGS